MGGGGKGGSSGADAQRAEEAARQARIREGTAEIDKTFGQFGDSFYNQRRDAALGYFNPQFDQQYTDARKALTFSLDNAGLANSSVRAEKEAELQRAYDQNRRDVADKALTYSTNARNNVEQARADLVRTLNASGDADAAANSAMARAQTLSQPDSYNPLGQIFSTFINGLGQQAQFERAGAASGGAYGGRYNTGLFGSSKSVKVSG
jgi:hypothetical protein